MLLLLFALEVGAVTQAGWVVNGFYAEPEPGIVYYTEFEAEAELLGFLFLASTLRTDVKPRALTNWTPFWVTYDITLGLRLGENVELGWRHLCTHPIQPYIHFYGVQVPVLEGGFEEVYLRLGGRM